MRRISAARSALKVKLDEGALFVVQLESFDRPSTARMARALAAITPGRRVLLLTGPFDENLYLSGRNVARLQMKQLKDVTAYEVLRAAVVLIDAAALDGDPLPALREKDRGELGAEPAAAPAGTEGEG